ncbi:MAG: Rha family transcriptional regulator, partial [Cyanobacteria bacterium J06648_11]
MTAPSVAFENAIAIEAIDGELRIDSRLVAEGLGVKHPKWFQNVILKYESDFSSFGILSFQKGKTDRRGRPQRFVLLNEDQFLFAGTLSRNTRPVIEFKKAVIRAFREERERDRDRKIVERFISRYPKSWTRRFHEEYYANLYRLTKIDPVFGFVDLTTDLNFGVEESIFREALGVGE